MSRSTPDATLLDSAAGSLLGNSDRGEPQHHVTREPEMDAVEPPDCAAPVEIGNGKRAPYGYNHPRNRFHSTYHLGASRSRGHAPFRHFPIDDGSPYASVLNRIELGAEIDVRHSTLPALQSLLHTSMCMRLAVTLRWTFCMKNAQIW